MAEWSLVMYIVGNPHHPTPSYSFTMIMFTHDTHVPTSIHLYMIQGNTHRVDTRKY